jgi:cardiolipin synthase
MWENLTLVGTVFVVFEILGVLSAARAVMTARTSQGAIAWSLALVTWPVITVPLFWILGRNKFHGYVDIRRARDLQLLGIAEDALPDMTPFKVDLGTSHGEARVLEELTQLPFTRHNDVGLLINGDATFEAIFAAIESAKEYILCQFFIVHDDTLGRELQKRLIHQARQGRRVYFLYDEVGSAKMTRAYLHELEQAGVHVTGMKTTRGWTNRAQLNFRNHRKIVVVDGREAYVGGHNVGDEYVGRHTRLTPWRDTHMRIEGPAVLATQLAFVEDWHWATQSVPQFEWQPHPASNSDRIVFVLPSGPADNYETCGLFFTHLLNCAKRRIWIASPYFVPDEGIVAALKLATMRGVDVRVLIPGLADKWFIKLAAMSYVPRVTQAGVKMYEYAPGFLHQKAIVIDDDISVIGTANFDNRSFRLNFEISVVTIDEAFAREVQSMFEDDFSTSHLMCAEELANRKLTARIGAQVARLFSPIL